MQVFTGNASTNLRGMIRWPEIATHPVNQRRVGDVKQDNAGVREVFSAVDLGLIVSVDRDEAEDGVRGDAGVENGEVVKERAKFGEDQDVVFVDERLEEFGGAWKGDKLMFTAFPVTHTTGA